jgi:hypothetical protein
VCDERVEMRAHGREPDDLGRHVRDAWGIDAPTRSSGRTTRTRTPLSDVVLNSHGHRNTDSDQPNHDFNAKAAVIGNWVGKAQSLRSARLEFERLGLDE